MVPFGFILLVVVVPFCRSVDFSFIREPDSEIIEDGHAIFMCEPSQSFATVQWFRDDQELLPNSSNVVKMSTCGRVHSLEVLENKRAKYHCVIGMKKSSLKLISRKGEAIPITIDEFSSMNTTDRQIEVSQGATAVIPCGPLPRSEPPAIPNVHFLKKRKRIILKLGHRFQVMPSGNVFVRNAQPKDSGEYHCLAENPLTDERREAPFKVYLNVRSQDREQPLKKNASLVHGPPLRTEAVIGSNVTMECLGDGFPTPQIQWKRVNSYLPEGHIEGENLLTLFSVTPKHAGVYECMVSNSGVTVRARTTLVVLEPPRLKEPQSKVYIVEAGKSLNLECEVLRGEPKPNITWTFNAEPLRSHSGRSIFVSEREVFIRKISKHIHEGGYQCFATNSLGSIYIQYLVKVVSAANQDESGFLTPDSASDGSRKGFPPSTRTDDRMKLPSPSKPDVQQISSSAVLITWLIDPTELSVLFFKVQYMVKGGEWKTLDVDVNPWQTAYQLDSLQPLQYRFRLIAVYENDDHRSSKPSRWITLVDMPEIKQNEAPQLTPIVSVSSDSPSSLTVQWKLEHPVGVPEVAVDGFILKYRRIDSAGEWTTHRQVKDAPRSFAIEHLKAGQHYEVKMAAFNQYGVGNFSTARVARTRDVTTRPPPPPVNQVPHDVSENENNNLGKEMPQRTAFQKHHLIAIAVIGATLGIISLVCLICAVQYGRNSPGRSTGVDKRLRREAAAYVNDANLNFTPSISTVDLASNSPNSKRFDDDDLMTDSEDSGSESMKSVSHEEVPRSEKEYALRILTQLYATNGHIVNLDTQSSRVHSV